MLAYPAVDFSFPDRPTLTVYLGVLVEQSADGGRLDAGVAEMVEEHDALKKLGLLWRPIAANPLRAAV